MNPGLKQVKTMKIYETWGSEMDELSQKIILGGLTVNGLTIKISVWSSKMVVNVYIYIN